MDGMYRDNIEPGFAVSIIQKKDQGTGKRTEGIVKNVLTKSPKHSRGIKVRLTSGEVGRVQDVLLIMESGDHGL